MRLILGPPGSGKTPACVGNCGRLSARSANDCRLIVPTATMGEHLRNELAREGFVFKPALVSTFTKFVEPYCVSTPAVNIRRARDPGCRSTRADSSEEIRRVRDFAGFRASIVHIVEEFSSAGGSVDDLARCGVEPDFIAIYTGVLAALKQRNLNLRAAQLQQAAEKIAGGMASQP